MSAWRPEDENIARALAALRILSACTSEPPHTKRLLNMAMTHLEMELAGRNADRANKQYQPFSVLAALLRRRRRKWRVSDLTGMYRR